MDKLIDKALSSGEADACQQLYNIIKRFATTKSPTGKEAPTATSAKTLLSFFLSSSNATTTRRWTGILLEAIVTEIPSLRQDVVLLTDLLSSLGSLTIRGDEDLMLVSATLIRALVGGAREKLSLFWPGDTLGAYQIEKFPLSEAQLGMQWIENLNTFMDDVFSQNALMNSRARPFVNFIQAAEVEAVNPKDDLQIMPENRSLYMIVQNRITIMAVPISNDPLFLDIPFDRISEVKTMNGILTVAQDSGAAKCLPQLILKLKPGAWNYLLYASEGTGKAMTLTFRNMDQVNRVAEVIDERLARFQEPKLSKSQTLNISQECMQTAKAATEIAAEHEIIEAMVPDQADIAAPNTYLSASKRRVRGVQNGEDDSPQEVASRTNYSDDSDLKSRTCSYHADSSEVSYMLKTMRTMKAKVVDSKTKGMSAGNLVTLSAALSPEPDEPVNAIIPLRDVEAKKAVCKVAQTKTHKRATVIPIAKKAEGSHPALTRKGKEKLKTIPRFSMVSKQVIASEDIWEIPDDPDEKQMSSRKKMAVSKKGTADVVPIQGGKTRETEKNVRDVESDIDHREHGSAAGLHTVTLSQRRLRRMKTISAEPPASATPKSWNTMPTKTDKSSTPKKPSIGTDYPKKGHHPKGRGRTQPIASSHSSVELSVSIEHANARETLEDFEEYIFDYESGQASTETGVKIKQVLELKPQISTNKVATEVGSSQNNSMNIASDPESDDEFECGEDGTVVQHHVEAQLRSVKAKAGASPSKDAKRDKSTSSPHVNIEDVKMADGGDALMKPIGMKDAPMTPNLIDSQSARKMSIISFDRSGPRNQGSKVGRNVFGAVSVAQSDLVQIDDRPQPEEAPHDKLVAIGENTFHTQTTLQPLRHIKTNQLVEHWSDKGLTSCEFLDWPVEKRQNIERLESVDDGFIPIDIYYETTENPSRRASQRSVHITDDGSPVRNDVSHEQLEAITPRPRDEADSLLQSASEEELVGETLAAHSTRSRVVGPFKRNRDTAIGTTDDDTGSSRKLASAPASRRSGKASGDQTPATFSWERAAHQTERDRVPEHELLALLRSTGTNSMRSKGKREALASKMSGLDQHPISVSGEESSRQYKHSNSSNRANFDDVRRLPTSEIVRCRRIGVMSSNHKPLPQPPGSASRAISGYAPEHVVQEAIARNQANELANNPFTRDHNQLNEISGFMQKISVVAEYRQRKQNFEYDAEDAEKTLVEDARMQEVDSLSSSDDQSSADFEKTGQRNIDNAEEMEWEAALHPSHRKIVDVLGRISRRLVSQLVDSEIAITDIINEYENDASFIIEELEKSYGSQRQHTGSSHALAAKLLNQYCDTKLKLANDAESVKHKVSSELNRWDTGRDGKLGLIQQLAVLSTL